MIVTMMKTTASREFLRARARSSRRFHTPVRQLNTTAIRPRGKKNRAAAMIDHTRCVRGWVGASDVTTLKTRPLSNGRPRTKAQVQVQAQAHAHNPINPNSRNDLNSSNHSRTALRAVCRVLLRVGLVHSPAATTGRCSAEGSGSFPFCVLA